MILYPQYWSNPAKPINMPQTEYNDKYIQPKLMSNIQPMQVSYVRFIKLKTNNLYNNNLINHCNWKIGSTKTCSCS